MVELVNYLDDGANWQAKAVLAYLQGHATTPVESSFNNRCGEYDAKLYVFRYDNGREHGYTISVVYNYSKQIHFSFFEGRNSDNIIVIHSNEYSGLEVPTGEFMNKNYKSKFDYDKSFYCCQFKECGKYIIDEIKKFVDSCVKEKNNRA